MAGNENGRIDGRRYFTDLLNPRTDENHCRYRETNARSSEYASNTFLDHAVIHYFLLFYRTDRAIITSGCAAKRTKARFLARSNAINKVRVIPPIFLDQRARTTSEAIKKIEIHILIVLIFFQVRAIVPLNSASIAKFSFTADEPLKIVLHLFTGRWKQRCVLRGIKKRGSRVYPFIRSDEEKDGTRDNNAEEMRVTPIRNANEAASRWNWTRPRGKLVLVSGFPYLSTDRRGAARFSAAAWLTRPPKRCNDEE